MARVVLAYSGGPASSAAVPWLREQDRAEVVTVTVDLGQREALDSVRQRAIASGAVRAHVLDWRLVFARDFLLPVVQAGAMTTARARLVDALGRPLVAKALVEMAAIEGAKTVAHAARTKVDASRIATSVKALNPALDVISVMHEWPLDDAGIAAYARARGIPQVTGELPSPGRAPADIGPAYVTVDFKNGVPLRVNGVEMDLVELLTSLRTIAQLHDTAGIVILGVAYGALADEVMPADLAELMPEMRSKYAGLIESGKWFAPAREAIDALMARLQANVSGSARVKVHEGRCEVVSRVN